MSRIFGLGETVLDVVFKDGKPVSSQPGGTAFNALVSLARAGHKVELISEIGNDQVGNSMVSFLKKNRVGINWLHRFSTGKTPVALAFLDKENNASYQVYKDFPEVRFQIEMPEFRRGDILLFGSFFAVNPVLRPQVLSLLKKARSRGAFLIYDPNFRKNHLDGIKIYRPIIEENFALAHLVRGSDEDFQTIYKDISINDALKKVCLNGAHAIVTANAEGVHALINGERLYVESDKIDPVSTIGAGDNFNAGLAYGLASGQKPISDINFWKEIIKRAIDFSTDVCLSFDNYISHQFASTL
ncbi:PfkB family carbohydrate kinase [Anaerophaga thermohalophila]|uniref:PfkB family carbohydrate kinase n=1 Tax=Anaerophaga thermohalophila TaxID=177400 RepID=UPI0003052EE3|nr:PfkB family carbohydrate kinase [Anaerophaga thermohalophila]